MINFFFYLLGTGEKNLNLKKVREEFEKAQLNAQPRLMEPFYYFSIQIPQEYLPNVYQTIFQYVYYYNIINIINKSIKIIKY